MTDRQRYWVINCPVCHNNYIRFANGRTIGKPCKHSTQRRAT